MPHNAHYISTKSAQWNHIGFAAVHELRQQQANQNIHSRALAHRILAMGCVAQRTSVLAQIFSPSGRIHVHHNVGQNVTCFPQSVCWRFPDRAE